MHLRSIRKLKREISLQEPLGVDGEGNEICLIDILRAECEPMSDVVDRQLASEALREVLIRLNDRERRVLVMRYGLDGRRSRTQKEVAQELGISRSYVSRIEKKAVTSLGQKISWEHCT